VPFRVRVNPQTGGLNPKGGGVGLEFTQSRAKSSIPWGLPTQDQQSAHGDGDGQRHHELAQGCDAGLFVSLSFVH